MPYRDIALAVLTMAIWGFNFVVIKIGLGSFPPLLFTALRFTLAAFPLILFVKPPAVSWRHLVAIGLFLDVAQFGLLFVSMSAQPIWGGMPAGLASLVLQTQSFFTLLFAAIVLHEKPRRNQLGGMTIAFMGIALLTTKTGQIGSIQALSLVILAAASWGIGNIWMKRANAPDIFQLVVWVSLVPPLPLFLLSWIIEGSDRIHTALSHLNWSGLTALSYVSFISTIAGFSLWGSLLKRHPANLIAPFTLLVPVFGILSAAIVLKEQLTLLEGASATLVLAGLVLNLRQARSATTATKKPNSKN